VHEILRQAIADAVGVRVQFKISTEGQVTQPIDRLTATGSIPVPGFDQSTSVTPTREFATPPVAAPPADIPAPVDDVPPPADSDAPPEEDDGWNVVSIPMGDTRSDIDSVETVLSTYVPTEAPLTIPENSRYGESVVRELMNATFISEETVEPPRVASTEREG
jgi:DNA polymerase-3 subunit gamma/tau